MKDITSDEYQGGRADGLAFALERVDVETRVRINRDYLTMLVRESECDRIEVDARGIYIASKTKHAAEWRALRAEGYPIKASWIDMPVDKREGGAVDHQALWHTNIIEAANARALVLFAEEGETAKGSLVEMGAALAKGVPVFYVGPADLLTALQHELVIRCASVADAFHRAVEET